MALSLEALSDGEQEKKKSPGGFGYSEENPKMATSGVNLHWHTGCTWWGARWTRVFSGGAFIDKR